MLLETHAEDSSAYSRYFSGYELYWKPATRRSRYGRAIGGCVFGVSKQLQKLGLSFSFESREELDFILLKDHSNTFSLFPTYIRGEAWNGEFSIIKSFFSENEVENPIVMGDLNIRIGERQQPIDEVVKEVFTAGLEIRSSKDTTSNNKGDTFLEFCNDFGLVVLNGVTKGDERGELTYLSTVGQSVNDFCCVSNDMLHNVKEFRVDGKEWSDHLPIILQLKINLSEKENGTKLLPKMKWNERKKNEYQQQINQNTSLLKQEKNDLTMEDIQSIVKKSYSSQDFTRKVPNKNKWFDKECIKARSKSFNFLNKFRITNDAEFKQKYLESNHAYKNLCKQKKAEYYDLLDLKIANVEDSKQWWSLAKEIRLQERSTGIGIDASDFRSYYQLLLNHPQQAADIQYARPFTQDTHLDAEITLEELKVTLSKVKLNKAAGEDRIPYEFFINATDEFLSEIVKVFNSIYNSGNVQECFEKSIIFPIFKKGDPAECANYRGISFMNCIAKLFIGIINTRLTNWTEENKILNEYQAGFRKGYSTMDNIYNITSIANLKFAESKKLYAFFIDFKAAFDKIPRKLLFYKLHTLGISTKLITIIESMYKCTKAAVWTGNDLSDYFETESGVKQGCLLSPLLFALYLNDMNDWLSGGVNINGLNVKILMYADDIVMLADKPCTLQRMIHQLESYCDKWNMELNLSKSEILIFRKGGRIAYNETWTYKGERVRIASEYCYLGVILTPRLSFGKHIEKRNSAAKNSINSVWKQFLSKKNVPLKSKWKLFQAVCRAMQCYGAQVFGYSGFDEIDKLQRFFLKRIYKLPTNTPNYAIDLEFGIENGYIYTFNLHQNYIMKTLFEHNDSRLTHMLSRIILQKNIFWAKEWNSLGSIFNVTWNLENLSLDVWNRQNQELLEILRSKNREAAIEKATGSDSRIYKYLDYSKGKDYINANEKPSKVSWILKARCDLIYLNSSIYGNTNRTMECSLCNLRENETISHFIGRCPILREFRLACFEKLMMSENEIKDTLNGVNDVNFEKLLSYLIAAIKYRKLIINEYN